MTTITFDAWRAEVWNAMTPEQASQLQFTTMRKGIGHTERLKDGDVVAHLGDFGRGDIVGAWAISSQLCHVHNERTGFLASWGAVAPAKKEMPLGFMIRGVILATIMLFLQWVGLFQGPPWQITFVICVLLMWAIDQSINIIRTKVISHVDTN